VATRLPLEPAQELEAAYLRGCTLEAAGRSSAALEVFHGLLQKDFGYADAQTRYRRLKETAPPAASSAQPRADD
jgi:thioredoxin-like negative regulator of GroEL